MRCTWKDFKKRSLVGGRQLSTGSEISKEEAQWSQVALQGQHRYTPTGSNADVFACLLPLAPAQQNAGIICKNARWHFPAGGVAGRHSSTLYFGASQSSIVVLPPLA